MSASVSQTSPVKVVTIREPKVSMNAGIPTRMGSHAGIGFTSITSFTRADFERRIEGGFRVCELGFDNPFRRLLADWLSGFGGLHCPPRTDSESDVEEVRIAHARDVAEALAEGGAPF